MTIFADKEKENQGTKLMGNPANSQRQCDFMSHYYDFVWFKVKNRAYRLEGVKAQWFNKPKGLP